MCAKEAGFPLWPETCVLAQAPGRPVCMSVMHSRGPGGYSTWNKRVTGSWFPFAFQSLKAERGGRQEVRPGGRRGSGQGCPALPALPGGPVPGGRAERAPPHQARQAVSAGEPRALRSRHALVSSVGLWHFLVSPRGPGLEVVQGWSGRVQRTPLEPAPSCTQHSSSGSPRHAEPVRGPGPFWVKGSGCLPGSRHGSSRKPTIR